MIPPSLHLVIIGGAEDRVGERTVLRAFVDLAGGAAARIVVVPIASEAAEIVGAEYAEIFAALGAGAVELLEVRTREDAQDERHAAAIERATGVFLSGGDQRRIMTVLGGTPVDTAIQRRCGEGMVVAGTSAGAAIMSGTMIAEGRGDRVSASVVRTAPGMELLPGVVVDQHFAQRGRIGRLLAVIAQSPHQLGIGIDEDTALVVRGHVATVIGSGAVTVIDAGAVTFNDAGEVPADRAITLAHVVLHSLPSGRSFDLLERVPVGLDAAPRPTVPSEAKPSPRPPLPRGQQTSPIPPRAARR